MPVKRRPTKDVPHELEPTGFKPVDYLVLTIQCRLGSRRERDMVSQGSNKTSIGQAYMNE